MKTMKIFSIVLSLCIATSLFGNNVQVGTASLKSQDLENKTYIIEFDISWENSWRTSTTDPYNWDAVWVFAKYKVGDDGVWKHVKLDNTTANHTILTNNGVAGTIEPSSDSLGIFMYRSADATGDINWDDVNLLWDYSSDETIGSDYVQVRVFALEMVYIPEGAFYIGDSAVANPFGQFMRLCKASDDTLFATPFNITSENEIILGGTSSDNIGRDTTSNYTGYNSMPVDDFSPEVTQTLPQSFPKGYNDFYIMKHELSQQAWVGFLNTLTRAQQNGRTGTDISGVSVINRFVMTNTANIHIESVSTVNPYPQSVNSRNGIKCNATLPATGPIVFYCDLNNNDIPNEADDGLWLPVNYVNGGTGILAYLDWSGLRPLSELELVKSARGSNYPVANEYAWGQADPFTRTTAISNDNQANEANATTSANCNFVPFTGNDDIFIPIRSGAFATSISNRITAGSSYFGVMDLSGNIDEYAMSIGNSNGRAFNGNEHGDGYLTAAGAKNTSTWYTSGIGRRLLNFTDYYVFSRVSNRYTINDPVYFRYINVGVRGARTAE